MIRQKIFLAGIFSLAGVLWAQASFAQSLTFETVLAHGLSESPVVKEIDAELADQLAESIAVSKLSNPQVNALLGTAANTPKDADGTQVTVQISQPLRLSHFGLREVVSSLMENAAKIEQKLEILGFSQRVFLLYSKLWLLQQQKIALTEAGNRTQKILTRQEKIVSQGGLNAGEAMLFKADAKKLNAQLLGIEADISQAKAEILRLSRYSVADRLLAAPNGTLIWSEAEIIRAAKENEFPIQEKIKLRNTLAKEQVSLAKRDAFPAFAPQVGYQRTEDQGNFIGVGLQFELPLFDRNQDEIVRKEGEAKAANAFHEYYQSEEFQNEIKGYLSGYGALAKQVALYKKEVIPTLLNAATSLDKQFSEGGGSIISVWQAQRELLDASKISLDLQQRLFNLKAEISILIGQQL